MIPASFNYKRASSVAEAIELIQGNSFDTKILAGGHSLIPAMKLRLSQPSLLVDIAKISELNFIRDTGKYFAIGAATTHGAIAAHKSINAKLRWIADVAGGIGDVQVRNRGTIGGSIAHADPASDWPAVLIAANASVKVEGANGSRVIAAADFFTGFFSTALEDGEIITEVHIPDPTSSETPQSWRSRYEKFAQPASRFALAGCAVNMQLRPGGAVEQVFVAFNGVGDAPYRAFGVEAALYGKNVSDETIAAAATAATEGVETIMTDHYADETYRRHLAQVVCKRALASAMMAG